MQVLIVTFTKGSDDLKASTLWPPQKVTILVHSFPHLLNILKICSLPEHLL